MIITTTDAVAGKTIVKTLGLVRGSTVRATHAGRDFAAFLRNLIGGEVTEYTKLLAEAREQALDRMTANAEQLGANAILEIRFATAEMMKGCAEIVVYGTAVIIE